MYVTERAEHLQIAHQIPEGGRLEGFQYNGGTFTIIGESEERDLVPAAVNWWLEVKQYRAVEKDTGEAVEVYVYTYFPVGHDFDMAIVDAIRPADRDHP